MITTKEIKIKRIENISSEYIDSELSKLGLDVLRWAITGYDDDTFTLNLAVVEN